MTFPDAPRLELDQLLAQLVERAQEVMATQGRLRGLLRASHAVTGDLALPAVLRHIVGAGRELIGARYAALAVVGPGGELVEFLHEGMPPGAEERIGYLPQGKGLLGALVDEPQPVRLTRLGEDPRSAGFPPGHPLMESFLGVPIRVRGEVFGTLYLTDSSRPGGAFTAEDEQLLTALAATAGAAIDNARLYESARARGEWLQASAAITRQLLAPSATDPDPLEAIADRTREVAHADLVVVLFPDPADPALLRIQVSTGTAADQVRGQVLPLEGSLSGQVFTTGEPRRLRRLADGQGLAGLASGTAELGPVLAVPLTGSGRVHGVLSVARLVGRPGFQPEDVDMVAGFANHAALAIELADARREQERAALLDDRERIATDLHDRVLHRLFAAGLDLQAVAAGLTSRPVDPRRMVDRVHATIRDLDAVIQEIRTSVFALHQEAGGADAGVRARLLDVVLDAVPGLGFQPDLRFSGALDGTLPEPVVEDLLAVLREVLRDLPRRAPREADVSVAAEGGRLTLEVCHDGPGGDADVAGHGDGLAEIRRRAEARGGTLTVHPGRPQGTLLRWWSPVGG